MGRLSLTSSHNDFLYAGQDFFMAEEFPSETPACRAVLKNFYAGLLLDISGYTVSLADMRKR